MFTHPLTPGFLWDLGKRKVKFGSKRQFSGWFGVFFGSFPKWNLVLQKWSQLVSSKESEIKISISPCSVSQFCQISSLSHSVQKGALEISSKIVGAVAQLAPMLSLSSHNFQRPLLSCVNIFSLHRLPSTLSALSFNSFFATLCNRTSNLAVLRVNSR